MLRDKDFNEFATTIGYRWIANKTATKDVTTATNKRKFLTRDVKSGYWVMTLFKKRKLTRPSTLLYTAPAIDYEPVDLTNTTSQTTFFDLPREKRNQLYRAYYELVQYVPWVTSPDVSFLTKEIQTILNSKDSHPEHGNRYSLQRLEEFFKVYQRLWDEGKVAVAGSTWHRDNQFSFTMYKIKQHNTDIHLDRANNRGVLTARFEGADELNDTDVEIRATVYDETDDYAFPSVMNFLPPDTYREIINQAPPLISDISVAFPLHHQWQELQELIFHDKCQQFMADPPVSPVSLKNMTEVQQWAVDVGVDYHQKLLYICGRAGGGKTTVALKICEKLKGRIQAGACTGKAASNYNGPTVHSMFGWSHDDFQSAATDINSSKRSKKIENMRSFYENTDVFIIDEVNAMSAASLAMLHETMTAIFNPCEKKQKDGNLLPFGGKKIIFLGDPAQLRPVAGAAIYDQDIVLTNRIGRPNSRLQRQSLRTKKGQILYQKYLVPNCIYLNKVQRTQGLLGEICDRLRNGKQTEQDLQRLTYQRRRFPDTITDFGIHFENSACSLENWKQLWNDCKSMSPTERLFVCKASYHTTTDNQNIVEALSALPSSSYKYAPDVLCLSVGCTVRLVRNINVAAGLVNSANGTVVKVIYNNADVQALVDGKHPPPYCIVVNVATFRGFLSTTSDVPVRPFRNQPCWVPIYREQFSISLADLPSWIRKKQLPKDCYRTQFPLDLSRNITCHRAQGQTMSNCTISVSLGLENPDRQTSADVASLLYVACTRSSRLDHIFVSPIFPDVWSSLGNSDLDKKRRLVDEELQKAAGFFASLNGKYREMVNELEWRPDSGNNEREWKEMVAQITPPTYNSHLSPHVYSDADFQISIRDNNFNLFLKPVLSERHIGLDQGVKNFAIAVVEKRQNSPPMLVSAENYTDLDLPKRFQAADVIVSLKQQTNLLSWMDTSNYAEVDRVIVHIEQVDIRNRSWKQFSIDLGKLLQAQIPDTNKCIVKLAQPHIHRATGPLFQLGDRIVTELHLLPPTSLSGRSRCATNPALTLLTPPIMEDVEPSGDSDSDEITVSNSAEYRQKKKMSRDVFRYVIEADDNQLKDLNIVICPHIRDYWLQRLSETNKRIKLDDVGDALLHALDELLCGSTSYRQLVPSSSSLHNNRTIALAIFPSDAYWVVLQCTWNMFVVENFGKYQSSLKGCFFKDKATVNRIRDDLEDELKWAVTSFKGVPGYGDVEHIKVVVKQLTGHEYYELTNEQAGSLTNSTSQAMKVICDECMSPNSLLCDRTDKVLGSIYVRTDKRFGLKYEVLRSTGKHTNAILSCLDWMTQNIPKFVMERRQIMNEFEKLIFFTALQTLSQSSENTMEMLRLSNKAKSKLSSSEFTHSDTYTKRNIADLILIGMNKNQQHIKAMACNSRRSSRPSILASS